MGATTKRLLLLGLGVVIAAMTLYGTVGRDTRLPASDPAAASAGAAVSAPQPRPTDTGNQAAERAQQLQARLAQNPRDADALAEVVDNLFQAKRYAQAAEVLSEAIDAGDDSARLRMGLGVALFYQGMPSLAQRELKRAVELDPNFVEARFNYALSLTHAARPDPDAARAAWQQVIQLDPDGDFGKRARDYVESAGQ